MEAAKMTMIAAMEPLLPDDSKELEDLATDLVAKDSGLATRLHPVLARVRRRPSALNELLLLQPH